MNSTEPKLVSLCNPVLDEAEKEAVLHVIDGGWLSMGERVSAFEDAFAALHEVDQALAVDSCTAGLHLCLAATGIGPGDEVLVPSLTFVATVNAVLYVGARPIFVDIQSLATPHISIEEAEDKCTSRTRAVIVMHYGGYLVDLPAWRAFADRRGLVLIEDAAHAPGVREVGQWGDVAAFSFFANKNMTTAEGGVVFARDPAVLSRMRTMRSHGMTTGTLERHRGHASSYDVTILGYNYRMDEIRAAIGLVQLEKLPRLNAQRNRLASRYRQRLAETVPGVSVPFGAEQETAAHIMAVLLPEGADRENVMKRMRMEAIQTSIHYPPVHRFDFYRRSFREVSLPVTDRFCAKELTLPLHPGLGEKELERVITALGHSL
ncbi:MAG: DegT/DnrJ/EryC1/StrS family aminotransferase [Syntrophobacteraceae bacterium]|nr:DegT/DnrJ/EryC1/StrS family aminotransferase [Syntrophobacteraceae bacterium]